MSEVRKGAERSRAESSDRHETILAEAFPASSGAQTDSASELHHKIARRLLAEGSPSRAYGELVRAAREAPMTPRLAAALVWLSLKAGTEAGALSLLRSGVDENEGEARRRIRSQLIRLLRRLGENEQAREQLTVLLAENPSDRNARAVLNALLHRDQRWEELDASLEREAREALKHKRLDKAARATFWRARISGEGLANPGRAALRYGQAAQYLEQAHQYDRAFDMRVLWLRGLHRAASPQRAIEDAIKQLRITADRVGKSSRADALIKELGLLEAPATGTGQQRRVTQQLELVAAAEEAERSGKKAAAAAMLSAAVQDTEDSTVERKLEALYVRRGAWRELAQFYRERVKASSNRARKLELLSRLAELLENELQDLPAAAAAYGEMVALGGDDRALKEQVRLLNAREDRSGIRRALDRAVDQASAPEAMAAALVARAETAIANRQFDKARADLIEVLRSSPKHLGAHAAFAELAAQTKDRAPVDAFWRALSSLPRRHADRAEYYRRLARIADAPLEDSELATTAWSEVFAEIPADEEAIGRLTKLLVPERDPARLEPVLRAFLAKEPRGTASRKGWRDLVISLEALGRPDDALAELRQAVRWEPGHQEAWLMLSDRTEKRGLHTEAAWALEQAATSTADDFEREKLWARLAVFMREVLKNPKGAETYRQRADKLKAEREARTAKSSGLPNVLAAPPRQQEHMKTRSVFAEPERTPIEPPKKLGASGVRPGLSTQSTSAPPEPVGARPAASGVRPALSGSAPEAKPGASGKANGAPPEPLGSRPAASGVRPALSAPATSSPAESKPKPPGTAAPAPKPGASGIRPGLSAPVTTPPPEQKPGRALSRIALSDEPTPLTQREEPLDYSEIGADADDSPEGWDSHGDVMEITTGEIEPTSAEFAAQEEWDAPPGRMDWKESDDEGPAEEEPEEERPSTQELAVPLGDSLNVEPSWMPSGNERRQQLFKIVREKPLDSAGYHSLADHFDEIGDADRSALMAEIGNALEGDPNAAPRAPKLILNATDRAGLRHPTLRHDVGELLSLSGTSLCRLFPEKLPTSARDEFRLDSGKGAPGAAEALLAAVRILGLRAPDLYLSEQNGPPFALSFGREGPRLAVGRLAVKKELSEAELRFFAGRALFTQNPDLLALRLLNKEQLQRGLHLLGGVLRGSRTLTAEGRAMRDALAPKALDRLRFLYDRHIRTLSLNVLMDGARHSANRAGLVVCGGVAPALAALKAKKALQSEIEELIRFAASERYLQLRMRRLGSRPA